jgi:uncharacterized protein
MAHITVRNANTQKSFGDAIILANNFFLRLRGLILRPRLKEGQGLLLTPCKGVHMKMMKQPLDVLFIGKGGKVVAMYPDLQPGGRTPMHGAARVALEVPPGTIERTDTRLGDEIVWAKVPKGGLESVPIRRRSPLPLPDPELKETAQ